MAITYSSPTITVTGGIDSGASSALGTTTTLNDGSKSLTVNQYAGRFIWIYSGTGAGQSRMIASHTTAGVYTIEAGHDWDTIPDATSLYRISYVWEDIYDQDVLSGWGVFNKSKSRAYNTTRLISIANTGFLGAEENTDIDITLAADPSFKIVKGGRYQQGRVLNNFGHGGGRFAVDTAGLGANSHLVVKGGGAQDPGDILMYGVYISSDGFFDLYSNSVTPANYWDFLDCHFDKFAGRFERGTYARMKRCKSLGNWDDSGEPSLVNVITPTPDVLEDILISNSTYALYCFAEFGGTKIYDFYWKNVDYLLLARRQLANTFVDLVDPNPASDFNATVFYDPAHSRGSNSPKIRMYTSWFPYARDAGIYEENVTYRVINNTSSEVALGTTVTTPTTHEILWRQIVYSNSVTNYSNFDILVTRYGFQSQRFSRSLTAVAKYTDDSGTVRKGEVINLAADIYIVASEATAATYSSKFTYSGASALWTVTATGTIQELYDYRAVIENTESNLQYIQSANSITTVDGANYTLAGHNLTLSGVDLTGSGTINLGSNAVNLNSGAETTLAINGGTVNIDTAQAYILTLTTNTVNVNATGTFNLTGCTISGTITLDTTATGVTVQLPVGTAYVNNDPTNITVEITAPSLSVSVTGMPDALGANNRLQIIHTTALAASNWATGQSITAGDIRLRSTGAGSESTAGLYLRAKNSGTTHATTEPTWNTTVGGTTTDNDITWTTYAILFYDNDPGASLSTSYFEGDEFKENEGYEYRFAEMDSTTSFKYTSGSGLATASGISVLISTSTDDVYATWAAVEGQDGSYFDATYSPNYTTDRIILDANLDYSGKSAHLYYCYLLTTSQGMYEFWGGFTAIDSGNLRNNDDIVDIYFDESAGFVKQTDNVRIFKKTDATIRPAIDPTTGGNGIEINWRTPVSVTEVNTGSAVNQATVQAALTAQGYTTARAPNLDNADAPISAVDTVADGIKAKTDNLTFTVANQVDVNLKSVKDSPITGAGTEADPWGP